MDSHAKVAKSGRVFVGPNCAKALLIGNDARNVSDKLIATPLIPSVL